MDDDILDAAGWGVVLPLEELQEILRMISHGPCQWTASLAREASNEWRTTGQGFVRIDYTNPEHMDMPNAISHLFPSFVESPVLGA